MAKKPALTNTKSIRRQQKIISIFNVTADSKLAQKYRDASWEIIQRDFGVLKPEGNTIPPKATAPTEIKEYLKYTEPYREHLAKVNLIGNFRIPMKYAGKTKEKREDTWSDFSSKDKETKQYLMPKELDSLAERVNLSEGLDPNSHYGYAAVYYSFTEDIDIADVLKNMTIIDKEQDVYTYEKKVK
jgi:hypothetical protein